MKANLIIGILTALFLAAGISAIGGTLYLIVFLADLRLT